TQALCQFTDFSHDTNGGHVPGYAIANSPLQSLTYTPGVFGHPMYQGPAPLVRDATSFAQWWVDSSYTGGTHTTAILPAVDAGGGRCTFATYPHNVYGGLFPLDPPANGFPFTAGSTAGPGTVTSIAATGEPLLCN